MDDAVFPTFLTDEQVAMVLDHLAKNGQTPTGELAELAGVSDEDLELSLDATLHAYELENGWVNLATLADGMVATHRFSQEDFDEQVLHVDADLLLLERIGQRDGFRLKTGGLIQFTDPTAAGLADGMPRLDPADFYDLGFGRLEGPPGWLAGFSIGDLVTLRLERGVLELGRVSGDSVPTEEDLARINSVLGAFNKAATEELARWAIEVRDDLLDDDDDGVDLDGAADFDDLDDDDWDDDGPEPPLASVVGVMASLLVEDRSTFGRQVGPLETYFMAVGLTRVGDLVGHAGVPTPDEDVDDLTVQEIMDLTFARGQIYLLGQHPQLAEQIMEIITSSEDILVHLLDSIESLPVPPSALAQLRATIDSTDDTQLAAMLMIEARSAEAEGRVDDAADLVLEVLKRSPDLLVALGDASEYVLLRGAKGTMGTSAARREGAVLADEFLARAGFPADHIIRTQLQPLISRPLGDAQPRNQQCACGSGKKYKVCCARSTGAPIDVRADTLYRALVDFIKRAPRREALDEFLDEAGPIFDSACLDLAIFETSALEDFRRTRGHWLLEDERELLDAWATTRLAVYEVISTQPGHSLTVRTLPLGEPIVVKDVSLSNGTRPGQAFLTRLLHDGKEFVSFMNPSVVSDPRRRKFLDLIKGDLDPTDLAIAYGEIHP